MEPTTLSRAQAIAHGVLTNVSQDQMGASTPCSDWTVGQLIDHLVGAQHWGRQAIQGVEMSASGEGASDGDYLGTFDQAAHDALAAFSADGALDQVVNPGFGDMPAPALLGMVVSDTFTHAWDLARATGQDTNLDPELAEQLLAQSRMSIPDSFRSAEGSVFGLEQEAPEGASAADQLAAFLGRTV